MCGIIGCITSYSEKMRPLTEGITLLRSRGPDNENQYINKGGTVALGHTRLSIIDTSEGANQPFIKTGDDLVLVFNGEIYNYKKIRGILEGLGHTFITTSDTEVLYESYKEWGETCVEHLDGIWAFCFYDQKGEKLFLSRDRIGEKPLIYSQKEGIFLFASEIPAILTLLETDDIHPSYDSLSQFGVYNFRHIPAPYTAYENIWKLEPGYSMSYDIRTQKSEKKRYLSFERVATKDNPIEDCKELLQTAVEQTCYAEVPVGILLSGGVDSSLIVSMMKDRDITTYSLGWDEDDEEILRADAIAKHLGVKNKKIYFKEILGKEDLVELIKKNITAYGEPVNLFQIIYSNFLLHEMKKDGIKVVIGGNGADELFYGYNGMNTLLLVSKVKEIFDFLGMTWIFGLLQRTKFLNSQNNAQAKVKLYEENLASRKTIKEPYRKFLYGDKLITYGKEIISTSLIDVFSWIGLRIENEHSITLVSDLSGSMNGMEIRTPFLNKDILSFACNLGKKYKIRSYWNKRNNKHILKKILCEYLPEDLVYKKKMGFGYGVRWDDLLWKYEAEFKKYILDTASHIPLYEREGIEELYKKARDSRTSPTELVDIAIVAIWWEQFIHKQSQHVGT